jgi:hypothetical protein
MNTSNPFGTESIARERQAQVEEHLRQAAQLRQSGMTRRPPSRRAGPSRVRLVVLATAVIITLAVAAFAV